MWAFGIQNPISMKDKLGIQVSSYLYLYLKRLLLILGIQVSSYLYLYLKRLLLIP
jgi:hypothetical protein